MRFDVYRALALSTILLNISLVAIADEPKSIEQWGEIHDPDGDCKIAEAAGSVTITIPGKHHDLTHTATYAKHNAPRILQPVKGDFTATVKVSFALPKGAASSGGKHAFVSSGLLLWQDEKNYIRLERAAVAASETPFVWVEGFQDGKSVFRGIRPVTDTDTSLSVARTGDKWKFTYDDGAKGDFVELPVEGVVDIPIKQVGVAAINSTDREHTAKLTGLALDKKN